MEYNRQKCRKHRRMDSAPRLFERKPGNVKEESVDFSDEWPMMTPTYLHGPPVSEKGAFAASGPVRRCFGNEIEAVFFVVQG